MDNEANQADISEAEWQKRVDKIRIARSQALGKARASEKEAEYQRAFATGLENALDAIGEKY